MPRERQSITHKFSIGGHEGYITAGMYEDGSVGEIFLTDIGKEGSTLRGMMNSFATAISISLQYGVPLETLVRKFSYMRFEPEGMTSNPEIPFAKSMPDYIMRWLASRFLDADLQEELGILTPEVRARKAAQDAASSHVGDTAASRRDARRRHERRHGVGTGGNGGTRRSRQLGHGAASRHVGSDRRAAGAAGGPQGPGPRAGLPAVRRHDAAHRQLLHVLELRVQHRLRIDVEVIGMSRVWSRNVTRGATAPRSPTCGDGKHDAQEPGGADHRDDRSQLHRRGAGTGDGQANA